MPISLTKTWNVYKSPAEDNLFQWGDNSDTMSSWMLYALKRLMVTQMGWTVVGSCDGTTGAIDGVDRWTDRSKLNWNDLRWGGTHSWIVLANTALGIQVCFDCGVMYGDRHYLFVGVSRLGYSYGANNNTRPTDPGDQGVILPGYWNWDWGAYQWWNAWRGNTWSGAFKIVGIQSTDMLCNRLLILFRPTDAHVSWACTGAMMFDRFMPCADLPAKVLTPLICGAWATQQQDTDHANVLNFGYLHDNRHLFVPTNRGWGMVMNPPWADGGSPVGGAVLATECAGGQAVEKSYCWPMTDFGGDTSSPDTTVWTPAPISIYGTDDPTMGRFGHLYDTYWGPVGCPLGATYGPTHNLAQFGQMIMPWDGSMLNLETP
jgi:hypothetical protein